VVVLKVEVVAAFDAPPFVALPDGPLDLLGNRLPLPKRRRGDAEEEATSGYVFKPAQPGEIVQVRT
jgi:hypothetical protein